ncbi:HEAT repeat domain-containing protein [Rosistilla oblonga]|uniref:HEAT repeat domain-containing protein n=1 Tax=Rosistilla oblonga TaxID=2527990 RepID=UPI003A98850D
MRRQLPLTCLLIWMLTASICRGYSPEHPEVMQMVDRGVAYLRTASTEHSHHPVGTKLLMAYSIFKVEHDHTDPIVKAGVAEALKYIDAQVNSRTVDHYFTYAGSLAMLLLLDVDHVKHEAAIKRMARRFLAQQKPHGGFGYPNEKEGDNSQNQYAVLGMWSLQKAGFEVPPRVMEGVALYLMQVQDPTGMWGYRGILPSGGGLVKQTRTQMSLTSAASGSLLIAGDFFGFYKDRARRKKKSSDDGLPDAVSIHQPESEKTAAKASRLNAAMINTSVGRAVQLYNKVPFQFSNFPKRPHPYYYYAAYAHERFMSFLENSVGEYENEPVWYNQGVEDLKRLQDSNGGWGGDKTKAAGHQIMLTTHENTAFAVLFLIRSTRRAIGELSSGTMQGGYGLPKSTKGMQTKGGQLIDAPKAGSVGGMLDLLEKGGDDVDDKAIYDSLILSKDPQERADQLKRLKRMVKGGPYKTRRAAARMLGQSSDMDIVPTLIFALTDPDKTVQREARNGLRFVSRRFEGFGLPDDPTPKQVEAAVKAWKEWYLLSNPSYIFLDEG